MPRRERECSRYHDSYSDCSNDSYSSDDSCSYRKHKTSKSHKKNESVKCDKCNFDYNEKEKEEEKPPTVSCDRCIKKHKKECKPKCCKPTCCKEEYKPKYCCDNKPKCDNGCKDGKYFFITLN